MGLSKINKYSMEDDLVDNEITLSRKVITQFMRHVNLYNMKNNSFGRCKLFINECFIDDLFSQSNFVMPPFDEFKKDGIIGKIAGTNVYVSDLLKEEEIFIGESEKELQILKRKDKISKILQNKQI